MKIVLVFNEEFICKLIVSKSLGKNPNDGNIMGSDADFLSCVIRKKSYHQVVVWYSWLCLFKY